MPASPFQPTEYAAALIQQLRQRASPWQDVLELGTGSGVVLAALLQAGAARGVGVDIEAAAVRATQALLAQLGFGARSEVIEGDLWAPLAGRRFDLVVTNLPQFPVLAPLVDGRLPSWSSGGMDGRAQIDRFLDGLAPHLQPGGRALMTHNRFADLDATLDRLPRLGLRGELACTVSVPLPPARWQALPESVRERFEGRGLSRVGAYAFAEFVVLELSLS